MSAPEIAEWTIDPVSGRSNSSREFLVLVDRVAELIRSGAWTLVNCGADSLALTIMAQLAHVHGLAPRGKP